MDFSLAERGGVRGPTYEEIAVPRQLYVETIRITVRGSFLVFTMKELLEKPWPLMIADAPCYFRRETDPWPCTFDKGEYGRGPNALTNINVQGSMTESDTQTVMVKNASSNPHS